MADKVWVPDDIKLVRENSSKHVGTPSKDGTDRFAIFTTITDSDNKTVGVIFVGKRMGANSDRIAVDDVIQLDQDNNYLKNAKGETAVIRLNKPYPLNVVRDTISSDDLIKAKSEMMKSGATTVFVAPVSATPAPVVATPTLNAIGARINAAKQDALSGHIADVKPPSLDANSVAPVTVPVIAKPKGFADYLPEIGLGLLGLFLASQGGIMAILGFLLIGGGLAAGMNGGFGGLMDKVGGMFGGTKPPATTNTTVAPALTVAVAKSPEQLAAEEAVKKAAAEAVAEKFKSGVDIAPGKIQTFALNANGEHVAKPEAGGMVLQGALLGSTGFYVQKTALVNADGKVGNFHDTNAKLAQSNILPLENDGKTLALTGDATREKLSRIQSSSVTALTIEQAAIDAKLKKADDARKLELMHDPIMKEEPVLGNIHTIDAHYIDTGKEVDAKFAGTYDKTHHVFTVLAVDDKQVKPYPVRDIDEATLGEKLPGLTTRQGLQELLGAKKEGR